MKKLFASLLFLAVLVLPSCVDGKFETTPRVLIDRYIIVNSADTVSMSYLAEQSAYCTDTLHVGDSVLITVAFDAVGNNITLARVNYQSEYAGITMLYPEEWNEWLTPSVTDSCCSFSVQEGYRGFTMQVMYVPKKEGSPSLKFRIESDSEYSPSELRIITPVLPAVAEKEPDSEFDPESGDE